MRLFSAFGIQILGGSMIRVRGAARRGSFALLLALAALAIPLVSSAKSASPPAKPAKEKCKPDKTKKPGKFDGCTPVTITAVVGVSGGTITSSDGLTMSIPFGALDSATTISVTTSAAPPPAGVGAVSPVYQFGPEGLTFAKPVTVTLPMPAGVTTGSIYWSRLGSTTVFDPIGGTISGGRITAEVPHFSLAVVGAASATRTVNGIGKTTWISASSRISRDIDFRGQTVEALIDDGQGGYARIAGVGTSGGFRILGVPVGEYILHAGKLYLRTSSDVPDLGQTGGGRPIEDRVALTQPTRLGLTFTVDALGAWQPGNFLEFYSTEADAWDFGTERFADPAIVDGATTITLPIDVWNVDGGPASTIDSTKGDRALIAELTPQLSANGASYIAMTHAAQLPPFDLPDGGTAAISLSLSDLSQSNTMAIDYRGAEFVDAIRAAGNPRAEYSCGFCGGFAGVFAQAYDAEDGFYAANADLLVLNDTIPTGTNVVTGAMSYGTPTDTSLAGKWGILFDARWSAVSWEKLPDTSGPSRGFNNGIEWVTTTAAAQRGPVTPPVSLPLDVRVNGAPAFAGGGDLTGPVTLTWGAPIIGSPTFYTVQVTGLFVDGNNGTRKRQVAFINTPTRSFTIPANVFTPDQSYVFTVSAVASTSTSGAMLLASAPFKQGLDIARAAVSSGVFGTTRGVHQPTASIVQDGLQFPMGVAVGPTGLYWTERWDSPWDQPPTLSTGGRIWKSGLDGSGPHVIAAGQTEPVGIAVDGVDVYWTNVFDESSGEIVKLDESTGVITVVVSGEPGLGTALLVANGDLYWGSGLGLRVLRVGAPAPENLAVDGGSVNLATDGVNLYGAQYSSGPGNSGRVLSVPLAGGALGILASGQAQAWDVATDGSFVYWSDQAWQQPFFATINRVGLDGSSPTIIAEGSAPESEIMKIFAIDATWAYYVDRGTVLRSPLAGGPAETYAVLPFGGCPEGTMVASGGNLYFSDTCANAVFIVTP